MAKTIEIFAGPNGSGKTTISEQIIGKRKNAILINTDKIASGIAIKNNEFAQYEAGRSMLEKLELALTENKTFSFETTMSGRIWVSHIKKAKAAGYKVIIYFIFVRSIELSLKRIKNRVKQGGHDVPKDIVKRRFERTFKNFTNLYKPLADDWYIIDNSDGPIMIAKKNDSKEEVLDVKLFKKYFS